MVINIEYDLINKKNNSYNKTTAETTLLLLLLLFGCCIDCFEYLKVPFYSSVQSRLTVELVQMIQIFYC